MTRLLKRGHIARVYLLCSVHLWSLWIACHGLFWYAGANVLEEHTGKGSLFGVRVVAPSFCCPRFCLGAFAFLGPAFFMGSLSLGPLLSFPRICHFSTLVSFVL